jgi:hypothetical protein
MRWAGHVARREIREVDTGFWSGDLMERDHVEDQGFSDILCFKMERETVSKTLYFRVLYFTQAMVKVYLK